MTKLVADESFYARSRFNAQSKSGRTSAPRLPQAVQTKLPSISESRTSSGHLSPLTAVQWLQAVK
jgi:hypothetical protein